MKKLMMALSVLTSVVAGAADIASVKDARVMTNTSSLPVMNLGLTAAEQAELKAIPFRFFSSIELKRRLQRPIAALTLDERLGSPLQFDPGRSALEHRMSLRGYRKALCDKSLGLLTTVDARTRRGVGGDVAFMNEMQGMSSRILQSSDSVAKMSPALEKKLVEKISAQLTASASAMKSASPTAVFGPLMSVDAFGGEHFRLNFKNLKAEVSLPMLLSFVTQKDPGFVRVLECTSRKLSAMMTNRQMHDKYWGMAPVRLAATLKQKGIEALEAHNLMARLSVPQIRAMVDTLIQLDAAAIMSPSEFNKKEVSLANEAFKAGPAAEAAAARLEFLQFLNRELGDYRDTKRSVILLRQEASK